MPNKFRLAQISLVAGTFAVRIAANAVSTAESKLFGAVQIFACHLCEQTCMTFPIFSEHFSVIEREFSASEISHYFVVKQICYFVSAADMTAVNFYAVIENAVMLSDVTVDSG